MLSFHVKFVQTNRRMDGQTNRRTKGQMDNSKTISPKSFDAGHKLKCILNCLP